MVIDMCSLKGLWTVKIIVGIWIMYGFGGIIFSLESVFFFFELKKIEVCFFMF